MKGGGSVGQSLHYVDPNAPERSAGAGSDLLVQRGLVARPAIGGTRKQSKGGFFPSIMTGVVDNALVAAPLAVMAGRRLLSGKTRKGGSRKGNEWRAQQEEAKAMLKEIGNPSARNVVLYAAAKRRNSAEAERFLNAFRNRKVKLANKVSAKRMAIAAKKEEKEAKERARAASRNQKKKEREAKALALAMAKEEKKRLREAAKAMKAATKKVKVAKPAARRTAKVAKGTHLFFNNEGEVINKAENKPERAMTELQIRREAEANAAAAKKEMEKPLKESQVAWLSLIDKASKQLKEEGIQSRANAMRMASLMKKGQNVTPFLQNLRSKRLTQKTAKVEVAPPPKTVARKTAKKVATAVVAAPGNNGATKKKPRSERQQAYNKALSSAKAVLGSMGKPTAANRARWASLKTSMKNNAAATLAAFEQNFRSRAPAAEKPSGKTAKKVLTAVAEANENNE
jgi:hypothetical protein